jgi:hypothetical protein
VDRARRPGPPARRVGAHRRRIRRAGRSPGVVCSYVRSTVHAGARTGGGQRPLRDCPSASERGLRVARACGRGGRGSPRLQRWGAARLGVDARRGGGLAEGLPRCAAWGVRAELRLARFDRRGEPRGAAAMSGCSDTGLIRRRGVQFIVPQRCRHARRQLAIHALRRPPMLAGMAEKRCGRVALPRRRMVNARKRTCAPRSPGAGAAGQRRRRPGREPVSLRGVRGDRELRPEHVLAGAEAGRRSAQRAIRRSPSGTAHSRSRRPEAEGFRPRPEARAASRR